MIINDNSRNFNDCFFCPKDGRVSNFFGTDIHLTESESSVQYLMIVSSYWKTQISEDLEQEGSKEKGGAERNILC